MLKKINLAIIIMVILFFCNPALSAEDAVGAVANVIPNSWSQQDKNKTILATGDEIFEQDTLVTDDKGNLDILFNDGTEVSLSPNSEVAIAEFVMSSGKNSFNMEVTRGVSRVVTGELVKRNPNGFKVTTKRTTVGIRGTTLTIGVGKDGGQIISVSDIGSNSHVTIIDRKTGKSFRIDKPGNSYVALPNRDGQIVQNTPRVQELLTQLETQGSISDETVREILKVVEQENPGTTRISNPTPSSSPESKKRVNQPVNKRPVVRKNPCK